MISNIEHVSLFKGSEVVNVVKPRIHYSDGKPWFPWEHRQILYAFGDKIKGMQTFSPNFWEKRYLRSFGTYKIIIEIPEKSERSLNETSIGDSIRKNIHTEIKTPLPLLIMYNGNKLDGLTIQLSLDGGAYQSKNIIIQNIGDSPIDQFDTELYSNWGLGNFQEWGDESNENGIIKYKKSYSQTIYSGQTDELPILPWNIEHSNTIHRNTPIDFKLIIYTKNSSTIANFRIIREGSDSEKVVKIVPGEIQPNSVLKILPLSAPVKFEDVKFEIKNRKNIKNGRLPSLAEFLIGLNKNSFLRDCELGDKNYWTSTSGKENDHQHYVYNPVSGEYYLKDNSFLAHVVLICK